jgi:hypothetical protein
MNRMALFVEGKTELEFDTKLIAEIAGNRTVTIELERVGVRSITTTKTRDDGSLWQHYFLIYDCGNDRATKTRMMKEYLNLAGLGYDDIFCHRDLGPQYTSSQLALAESERGLLFQVPTAPIPVRFVLSVMGIEAWFLAEHTHLQRIDPAITCAKVSDDLGFDPSVDNMQARPTPAKDLSDCYWIVLRTYSKSRGDTLNAIDYGRIIRDTAGRFRHLQLLCDAIAEFLDRP